MSSVADLLPYLQNKYVEISIGDEYEEIVMSDHTKKINVVIYGKVIGTVADFLILNCFYIDSDNNLQKDNTVYLNTWNIKAITEITPENNGLNSVFLSASHNKKIRKLLGLIDARE